MSALNKFLVSMVVGFAVYASILYSALSFTLPIWLKKAFLWNVMAFSFLGQPPPPAVMPNGHPVAASSGLGGFSFPSIFTGFIIYPVIVFAVIYLYGRIRRRSN